MSGFFLDLVIVAVLIIGITAINGVFANGVGNLLGGKKKSQFVDQTSRTQTGWKQIGGIKKS